ncbi:mCG148499 [Mus musculus]|nr:mCG148499 [Mus musculus]
MCSYTIVCECTYTCVYLWKLEMTLNLIFQKPSALILFLCFDPTSLIGLEFFNYVFICLCLTSAGILRAHH